MAAYAENSASLLNVASSERWPAPRVPRHQRFFLAVAERVVRLQPDVLFLFAGAGEEWHWLQNEVSRRGLKDHVLLLGHRDDAPEVLAAMNVFLLTSAWEGLPSALVEAAAAKVPIVTTAVSGVRDILEHDVSALIFPVGDVPALADGVVRLLSEPNHATALAARARCGLQVGFEPRVVVDEHARLYRDMGLLPVRKGLDTEPSALAESVG